MTVNMDISCVVFGKYECEGFGLSRCNIAHMLLTTNVMMWFKRWFQL